MKNQTAIEWLLEKYELVGMFTPPMIERAKAMEKQQVIDARQDGVDVVFKGYSINNEEYYNQTYGGDK
jgi:hypothetical protein